MLLDLMKALWDVEIRVFIWGASRIDIILATILATPWIKLIGRKSEIASAPSFLGMRTTFAELSQWKFSA
jgi:hypothetical protein